MNPSQLLEMLTDVLASIDSFSSFNIRQSSLYGNEDLVECRVIPCLSALEYPFLPCDINEMKSLIKNIAMGERSTIQNILHFCLDNQSECREKTYLSSYLTPIQYPLEVQHAEWCDDDILEQIERYQLLQDEFQGTYGSYIKAKRDEEKLKETVEEENDLESLKCEKFQLLERIQEVEQKVKDRGEIESFSNMLSVTKLLRIEQKDEMNLQRHLMEQQGLLMEWEQKLKQLQEACRLRYGWDERKSNFSLQSILSDMQKDITEIIVFLKSDLDPMRIELQAKVDNREKMLSLFQNNSQYLEHILVEKTKIKDEIMRKKELLDLEKTSEVKYKKMDLYYQVSETLLIKFAWNMMVTSLLTSMVVFSMCWFQNKSYELKNKALNKKRLSLSLQIDSYLCYIKIWI